MIVVDMVQYAVYMESVFHGYGNKVTLHNIDMRIRHGSFVSLVGPSGCGKSTLLRLITGQERVKAARRIEVLGKQIGFPDKERGVVFQQYTLQPHLTVLENVMLGLQFQAGYLERFLPSWKKNAREIAMSYLEKMRLLDAANKYPGELSGGMQQRAAIAQTIVTIENGGNPKILCMDEPFSALDEGTREYLQILTLELWEKYGMTVVFVTHSLEEAVYLSTRIIVLSPFWISDEKVERLQGSRIVMDLRLDPHAMSTTVKGTKEFTDIIAKIRNNGFNPNYRRHVNEFNIDANHRDFFQTLSTEESKDNGIFSEEKFINSV